MESSEMDSRMQDVVVWVRIWVWKGGLSDLSFVPHDRGIGNRLVSNGVFWAAACRVTNPLAWGRCQVYKCSVLNYISHFKRVGVWVSSMLHCVLQSGWCMCLCVEGQMVCMPILPDRQKLQPTISAYPSSLNIVSLVKCHILGAIP